MKAVVVTGASTGIGAACVELLVENGYLVFGCSRGKRLTRQKLLRSMARRSSRCCST